MRTFVYTAWSGATRSVEADRIQFEPSGHVTYWIGDRLVLAERLEDSNSITEVVPEEANGG